MKIHAAESLQCWKQCKIFRHVFDDNKLAENRDRAFMIYFEYVVPGSRFEVSTPDNARHTIEYQLAAPPMETFEELAQLCWHTIQENFISFSSSEEYSKLPQLMLEESKRRRRESMKAESQSCAVS